MISRKAFCAAALTLFPVALWAQPNAVSGTHAFAVEAGGAVIGSLIGATVGVVATRNSCGTEDLTCDLGRVGATLGLATVGGIVGAIAAGRAGNTNPSTIGSILGSVAGAAAGLGVVHLMTEELNIAHGNTTATILAFSITQGIVTAVGSRLFRSR